MKNGDENENEDCQIGDEIGTIIIAGLGVLRKSEMRRAMT